MSVFDKVRKKAYLYYKIKVQRHDNQIKADKVQADINSNLIDKHACEDINQQFDEKIGSLTIEVQSIESMHRALDEAFNQVEEIFKKMNHSISTQAMNDRQIELRYPTQYKEIINRFYEDLLLKTADNTTKSQYEKLLQALNNARQNFNQFEQQKIESGDCILICANSYLLNVVLVTLDRERQCILDKINKQKYALNRKLHSIQYDPGWLIVKKNLDDLQFAHGWNNSNKFGQELEQAKMDYQQSFKQMLTQNTGLLCNQSISSEIDCYFPKKNTPMTLEDFEQAYIVESDHPEDLPLFKKQFINDFYQTETDTLALLYDALTSHTYKLNGGGVNIKSKQGDVKKYAATAGGIVKKLNHFNQSCSVEEKQAFIADAIVKFSTKKQRNACFTLFNLGTRDKTTADLYAKCLKILVNNGKKGHFDPHPKGSEQQLNACQPAF